jgi:hypothetical protein
MTDYQTLVIMFIVLVIMTNAVLFVMTDKEKKEVSKYIAYRIFWTKWRIENKIKNQINHYKEILDGYTKEIKSKIGKE